MTGVLSPSWWKPILSPLGYRLFAFIWFASLVSRFGSLIQVVGASWLMTSLAPSPDMVSLVQASSLLPIMLLSLVAGSSADVWDRRSVMLISQAMGFFASALLSVLAYMDSITPWTLLSLTFLNGCGGALYQPAWQSSVSEQVPQSELSAAISLDSVSLSLARTAGPAIGGILVVAAGPAVAFLVNSLTYIGVIAVLVSWRRTEQPSQFPAENMLTAMVSGIRYARFSHGIRTVLLRSVVFGLLGSTTWALMPLVARDLLNGGADTYGWLFGSWGAGAILGAVSSVSMRLRYDGELLVRASTVGVGIGIILTATSLWEPLTMAALLLTGACWVMAVSTFNVVIQASSPAWVVGRTVAIFHTVIVGGLAIGSWLSGLVANECGLSAAMLISGLLMVVSAFLGWVIPLRGSEGLNLSPSVTRPTNDQLLSGKPAYRGPVVVAVTYRVKSEDVEPFLSAMRELRDIRRRNGAKRLTLLHDVADTERWIECYRNPNWAECVRQHHRLTVDDQETERRVLAFHRGLEAPRVEHLIVRVS
jgi:MFS family permease